MRRAETLSRFKSTSSRGKFLLQHDPNFVIRTIMDVHKLGNIQTRQQPAIHVHRCNQKYKKREVLARQPAATHEALQMQAQSRGFQKI